MCAMKLLIQVDPPCVWDTIARASPPQHHLHPQHCPAHPASCAGVSPTAFPMETQQTWELGWCQPAVIFLAGNLGNSGLGANLSSIPRGCGASLCGGCSSKPNSLTNLLSFVFFFFFKSAVVLSHVCVGARKPNPNTAAQSRADAAANLPLAFLTAWLLQQEFQGSITQGRRFFNACGFSFLTLTQQLPCLFVRVELLLLYSKT